MGKILIFFCFIISCTETTNLITTHGHEKLGFTITNESNYVSKSTGINVHLNRILDTLPIITINGNPPDTPFFEPTNFIFSNIKTDSIFSYKFIYNNDTLSDDIFLPGSVDSLFSNGIYLKNDSLSDIFLIDSNCDSINFHWTDNVKPKYYKVFAYSDIIDNYPQTFFTPDSFVNIKIKWRADENISHYGITVTIYITKMASDALSETLWANKISRDMYAYYQISGAFYSAKIRYFK
ncbi:MAG: hypothetical protein JXI43_09820 [Tissierellales bacterium]|nr:hypothetical protein [Tissierellales bacterium]